MSGHSREGSGSAPLVAPPLRTRAIRDRSGSKACLIRSDLLHILDGLAREVSRPLASLRAGFHFILNARAEESVDTDPVWSSTMAMADLCDQLLVETRSLLESVAIAELGEVREVRSFHLSGIVVALEREFHAIAKARRIALIIDQIGQDKIISLNAEVCLHTVGGLIWDVLNMTPSGGTVTLRITNSDQACMFEVIGDSGRIELASRLAQEKPSESNDEIHRPLPGPGSVIAKALLEPLGGEIRVIQASESCLHVAINYV